MSSIIVFVPLRSVSLVRSCLDPSPEKKLDHATVVVGVSAVPAAAQAPASRVVDNN